EIGVAGGAGRERSGRGGAPRAAGAAPARHAHGHARRAAHRPGARGCGRLVPVRGADRPGAPDRCAAPAADPVTACGAAGVAGASDRCAALRGDRAWAYRSRGGLLLCRGLPGRGAQRARAAAARRGSGRRRGDGAGGEPRPGVRGMRLHRLGLAAVGPYPTQEGVEFDVLGEDGVVLRHGDTGAGKTTLLDAVAFALFGAVPGVRGEARRLRCDYASEDTPTVVSLELTVQGHRLRLTRSPAYVRRRRRGNGTTEQPAKVS